MKSIYATGEKRVEKRDRKKGKKKGWRERKMIYEKIHINYKKDILTRPRLMVFQGLQLNTKY